MFNDVSKNYLKKNFDIECALVRSINIKGNYNVLYLGYTSQNTKKLYLANHLRRYKVFCNVLLMWQRSPSYFPVYEKLEDKHKFTWSFALLKRKLKDS
jgi:hypothetical protein